MTPVAPTLVWLDVTDGAAEFAPLWKFLSEYVAGLSAGRYRTVLRHSGRTCGGIRHPATRILQDAASLAAANRAAAEADVLVLGCWGSPTVAVRSILEIPVAALAEASILATRALAARAAVVTVAPSLVAPFAADCMQISGGRGLLSRPVWAYDPASSYADVVEALERPGALINRFDAVARDAVSAGADAIITGCGYLGPVFASHGYTAVRGAPDVPVLDCTRMGFEHANMLYRLASAGHGPSSRGYARPTQPALAAMNSAMASFAPLDALH